MSNSLSFLLKLQDMLSPGLRTAVKVSNTASDQIQKQFDAMGVSGKKLGASVNELRARLDAINKVRFSTNIKSQFEAATRSANILEKQIAQMEGKSNKSSSGGGAGMWKSIVSGNLIAGAVGAIPGMIGGAITDTVGKAMEFGKTKKSFQVLTGDAAKGDALANELNKLQSDTILGTEVFKNAQTMLGFGVAADKVVPTLKMLGDISMGDAEKLNGLSLVFSQVKAQGKLMGNDLYQMINNGFNPLDEISRTTGKSMGELKQMMEKGQISFAMVENAMKTATGEGGKFHNMMQQIAETPAGKMAQLEGAWDNFKIKVGDALMPLASLAMDLVSKLLPLAETIIPYITQGVSMLIAGFTELTNPTGQFSWYVDYVKGILYTIWDVVSFVGLKIWNIVSGIIQWMAKSEIIQDIFWLIGKVANIIGEVVKGIASVLEWVWNNIVKPILDAIEWVYKKVKGLFGGGNKTEVAVTQTVKAADVPGMKAIPGGKMPVTPTTANAAASTTPQLNAGKDKSDSINGGGQRSIVIHIGKQIEKLEVHQMSSKESAEEIGAIVVEQIRRTLYSLNSATGS
jgi:tape measure domain-containing protein